MSLARSDTVELSSRLWDKGRSECSQPDRRHRRRGTRQIRRTAASGGIEHRTAVDLQHSGWRRCGVVFQGRDGQRRSQWRHTAATHQGEHAAADAIAEIECTGENVSKDEVDDDLARSGWAFKWERDAAVESTTDGKGQTQQGGMKTRND